MILGLQFLMPWDKEANLLPHVTSKKAMPVDGIHTKITRDGMMTFRGKVHDEADKFSIELTNTQSEKFNNFFLLFCFLVNSEFKGIRLMVKFEEGIGKVTFEKLLEVGKD